MEEVKVRFDEPARWLALERGSICLVCSLNSRRQTVPLPCGSYRPLLLSASAVQVGHGTVSLPPDTVAILKR